MKSLKGKVCTFSGGISSPWGSIRCYTGRMKIRDRILKGTGYQMDSNPINRRTFLWIVAGTGLGLVSSGRAAGAANKAGASGSGHARSLTSGPKDYKRLVGSLEGFSAALVQEHVRIYREYYYEFERENARDRFIDLATSDSLNSNWRDHCHAWLNLRNALVLHENYFDALTPLSMDPGDRLKRALTDAFGSFDQWWVKFRATALAVQAWAALVWDEMLGRPVVIGIDNSNQWAIGSSPLLVVDMAEHAYCLDYVGRPVAYLDAWRKRVNWKVVEARLLKVARS